MANFISSFFGNLNNEALEITQQSEVVDWLGNRGWNYSGSDYIVNNFNHNRQPTQSGVSINGRIANTISAYWACVQMIASDIAKLPLNIYEDDNRGNPQIRNNHPLYKFISISPDRQVTAQEFWETMILHCLTWGNGYALLGKRDVSNGQISGLQCIHPNQVQIMSKDGIRYYKIYPTEEDKLLQRNELDDYDQSQIFHLHGPGDGWSGWPIANFAKEALGITQSLQSLQASLFANGMNLGGILKTNEKLDPQHREQISIEWTKKYAGPYNNNKVALLDQSLDYKPLNAKATDSEVLESRKFQIAEIARYFRVPLHKLGITDASTLNNVEQENLKYVTETLMPWITRIQNLIKHRLFPESSRFYAKFDTKDLILADAESKAKFWKEGINNGWATPNQAAQDMGLPVYPDGNDHYIPANNLKPVTAANIDLAKSKEELKQLKDINTSNSDDETKEELISKTAESDRDNPSNPSNEDDIDKDSIQFNSASITNIFTLRTLIEDRLKNFVNREVKFHKREDEKKVLYGKEFNNDKFLEKEAKFYNDHKNVLCESLVTYFEILNMPIPSGFFDKWHNWKECENWADKKAFLIANDFILHYTGLSDHEDSVFDYDDPDTGKVLQVRLTNGILKCS